MPLPEWAELAERPVRCALKPLVVQDQRGERVRILPRIGWHHELTVLCGDWIPVRADGRATFEQMVHSPQVRLPRARNVEMAPRDAQGVALGTDRARFDRMRDVGGELLLVGGDPNYYHWLIDYLPRLLLALKHANLGSARLLVNENLAQFQIDSLSRIGFGEASLLRAGHGDAVRARSVLAPALLSTSSLCHPVVPQWLRERFKPVRPRGLERVYLSRHDAPTRTLTNEDELTRLLERFGYVRVLPGALSFQEQVDLCASMRHVVAVHGAALTNLVFCPAGATVLEIHSTEFRPTFMRTLARHCGHQHTDVPARVVTHGPENNPQSGTWEADLDVIEAALVQIHGPA